MATATKIEQVRRLRQQADNLRGATDRWREKYSDRAHYDKQAFGFSVFTERSCAFTVPKLAFEAYVGTYGCSSVGTTWNVDQVLVERLIVKALNANKQAILDSMADLADAEADELLEGARKELAEIQKLLAETDTVEPA